MSTIDRFPISGLGVKQQATASCERLPVQMDGLSSRGIEGLQGL